jgi:hypothetical protein
MLELNIMLHGFAAEVYISCSICEFTGDANPTDQKEDYIGKAAF